MKVNETLDAYYDLVEVYKDLDPYDQEMMWPIIQTVKKQVTSEKRIICRHSRKIEESE